MNKSTIQQLRNTFVGKVSTILTTTISKTNFQDQQFSDFFSVIIESIEEDGIFAKHYLTGCKNFYSWNYVVGILEEQVISENDPKYKEIMEEVKKVPTEAKKNIQPVNPYVDPDAMAKLVNQSKMMRKQ